MKQLYFRILSTDKFSKTGKQATLSFFLFIISSASLFAAKYTTKQNGNWGINNTWENNTPPPITGNGNGAFYSDSIIIKHKINIGSAIIRIADYIEVESGGRIFSSNANNGLTILDGAVGINRDSIELSNVTIEGDFYNYNYLKSRDLTISDIGYFYIGTGAYVQTTNPANNQGVIFNSGTLYSPSNFINNNGTITGDGGTYLVDGNLTNNAGAVATCANGPINICRTDGTNPTINGSGTIDSGCVMICGVLLGGALPVKLISFNATYDNEEVLLTWKTATEINNHYFEVQKSIDGKSWEVIDKVYSRVINSSELQSYNYTDNSILEQNETIYYRLKQVDTDGKYEYLPVIHVKTFVDDEFHVDVFPNPASNNIGIKISNTYKDADCEVRLVDFFGAVIFQSKVESNHSLINISSEDIPVGMYYVVIKQGNIETVKKVRVQH